MAKKRKKQAYTRMIIVKGGGGKSFGHIFDNGRCQHIKTVPCQYYKEVYFEFFGKKPSSGEVRELARKLQKHASSSSSGLALTGRR
ncbi:MAG: hypothetical protein PHW31_04330 [Candidatus Pacebacteria bacterium]|nr:hypothetical protein [Candidatus Paceibacterota bacterium]